MPANYAHYRFGNDVINQLTNPTIKKIIKENYDLFCIGVHGPDLLFYHKPIKSNPTKTLGTTMHKQHAYDFFKNYKDASDASLAYYFGFLCHYSLDRAIHPVIEPWIQRDQISHIRIETMFEKSLMKKDKICEYTYSTAKHIHKSNKTVEVIAHLLGIKQSEVVSSIRWMKGLHVLFIPNPIVEVVLRFAFKKLHLDDMEDLLLHQKELPCDKQNVKKMTYIYEQTIPVACNYLENFYGFTQSKCQLDEGLKHIYEAE